MIPEEYHPVLTGSKGFPVENFTRELSMPAENARNDGTRIWTNRNHVIELRADWNSWVCFRHIRNFQGCFDYVDQRDCA